MWQRVMWMGCLQELPLCLKFRTYLSSTPTRGSHMHTGVAFLLAVLGQEDQFKPAQWYPRASEDLAIRLRELEVLLCVHAALPEWGHE